MQQQVPTENRCCRCRFVCRSAVLSQLRADVPAPPLLAEQQLTSVNLWFSSSSSRSVLCDYQGYLPEATPPTLLLVFGGCLYMYL